MSELARLFGEYVATVPEFEEIERKPPRLVVDLPEEVVGGTRTSEGAENTQSRSGPSSMSKPRGRRSPRDPRETRTVFVGNIPSTCTRRQIRQLFKTCGKVETVRVRCLQVKEGKLPRKVAMRTHKQLMEESTFNAYVVFSLEDEAEKSLKLNGRLLNGRHLRVDLVSKKNMERKHKETQLSVFVGNLPFTADEEKLRSCFSNCGDVESVRIIRDAKTGIGKGFGFVSFSDKSGVMFAVKQNRRIELDGRKLRVFKSKDEQTLRLQKQAKLSGMKSDQLPRKKVQKKQFQSDRNSSRTDGFQKKKGSAVGQRRKTKNSSMQRKTFSKKSGARKKITENS